MTKETIEALQAFIENQNRLSELLTTAIEEELAENARMISSVKNMKLNFPRERVKKVALQKVYVLEMMSFEGYTHERGVFYSESDAKREAEKILKEEENYYMRYDIHEETIR